METGEGSLIHFLKVNAAKTRSSASSSNKRGSSQYAEKHFDNKTTTLFTFQEPNYNNNSQIERRLFDSSYEEQPNQYNLFNYHHNNPHSFTERPYHSQFTNSININPEELYSNNYRVQSLLEMEGNSSFQSAKAESTACLEKLSSRIRGEISNIDIKI